MTASTDNIPGFEHAAEARQLLEDAAQMPSANDETNPPADRNIAEAQARIGLAVWEALADIVEELGILRRQHQGY